jgi:beta-N-acetylhexosaminidase
MDLPLPALCGQLLVGGFHGTILPPEMRRALSDAHRGGVIVFKRNLSSLEQTRELCVEVAQSCPRELPPFIGVDQEGGRVSRLPPPFLKLPAMRELGALADAELVTEVGRVLGAELAALGLNLDFSPVLDVDTNPQNPVIGDRAFSGDPALVAVLGRALTLGLQSAGVMACGKHFPGHGDTEKDSHLDLPRVEHDEARLRSIELPPFREACRSGAAALMTAHVIYTALDPEHTATLSPRIATELLRGELGFQGVLFSDDLEMRALSDRMSVEESAVGAIRAGCDALLVCSDFALQEAAHGALVREAERDSTFRDRCRQAAQRGIDARRRRPPRPASPSEARASGERARRLEAELARRLDRR